MAMAFLGRTLITKPYISSIFSRSFSSTSPALSNLSLSFSRSSLLRLRPLVAVAELRRLPAAAVGLRCFATRPTTSSLNDPSPNWNNRPPKETILLDGCDFEHWLIVMEKPEGEPTRDEIIDSYIKTLAMVLGSEEEARKSIYSVSTRHYFAFGCIVSEEISYKIKELPRVRWVLPDSYLDVKNKDYGGEPFINGQAVPYDPKYHEEWVRNNARANERSRRNDRPRNFDRSRNFERRRENMQNRDFQNRGMPSAAPNMPPNNPNMYNTAPSTGSMPPPSGNMQNNAPNMGGMPPPSGNMQNNAPNMGGMPPPNANMNMGGGMPNRDAGPNAGYFNPSNPGNVPNRDFQYGGGGTPYQSREGHSGMPNMNYQSNYAPSRDGGSAPPGNPYQQPNRDMPGRDLPPMPNQQDYQ